MKIKKFLMYAVALAGIVAVQSCKVKNKDVKADIPSGTYEVMLPAADGPGRYVMLAISDSTYEMYEKYLDEETTFLSKGVIKTNKEGKLDLGDDILIDQKASPITVQGKPLIKVSDKTALEKMYTTSFYKDDVTGDDYEVSFYNKDGKACVQLSLNGQTSVLNADSQSTETIYTDGKQKLTLEDDDNLNSVVLNNGSDTHKLTLINPVWTRYQGEDGGKAVAYETLFFDDGVNAALRLFTDDITKCLTLKRTEASAKTAVFSDGKTTFSTALDHTATLKINGKTLTLKPQKD